MFNNLKRSKITLSIIAIVLLLSLTTQSFAWLADIINFTPDDAKIDGTTDIAYFESGNGSPDSPYIISAPMHLYNLAWLQYLGYFNLGDTINNGRAQSYFKLKNDIDMSELNTSIPAIGTSEYPFLGGFNGNGKIISNLNTSNDKQELTICPMYAKFIDGAGDNGKLISAYVENSEVANINGFFGVVGDYNGKFEDQIENNERFSVTIDSNVTPNESTPGPEDVFFTNGNVVTNFGMLNCTVNNISSKTTVGIVAGRVNAPVNNVLVCDCSVTVPTGAISALEDDQEGTVNFSDFTTIGYATPEFCNVSNVTNVNIYANKNVCEPRNNFVADPNNENGNGLSTGWGGSVAMQSLHTRMTAVYNNKNGSVARNSLNATQTSYVYRAAYAGVNENNLSKAKFFGEEQTNAFIKSSENQSTHGSYIFTKPTANAQEAEKYLYLSGGTKITTKYIFEYTGNKASNAYVIGDSTNGANTYYLTANSEINDSNINTASSLTATQNLLTNNAVNAKSCWYLGNDGSLSVDYEGILLYLDLSSSGQLVLNYLKPTDLTWAFVTVQNQNCLRATRGETNYYAKYNSQSGVWDVGSISYRISSGNNYLSNNNTTITNVTSNAPYWFVPAPNSSGYIYRVDGNTTYYLAHGTSNRSISITTTPSQASCTWTRSNSNQLYYTYTTWGMTVTGYLRYNSGNWSVDRNSSTFTFTSNNNAITENTITNSQLSTLPYQENALPNELSLHTTEENTITYTEDNSPYIPLKVIDDDPNNDTPDNYSTANNNTGYIISGPYDETSSEGYPIRSGDIRVSSYTRSSSLTDPTGTIFTKTVKTQQSNPATNGYTTIPSPNIKQDRSGIGLFKFDDSYTEYTSLVSGQNVFGLHFMNGVISKNNLVVAPKATFNGDTYKDYEMPGDCIDFRLQKSGFVNFYAGTYFPNNNMFFSFHQIIRDENQKITDIKEISKIYKIKDNITTYSTHGINIDNPYLYLFYDGNYSVPSVNIDDFDLAFDCAWINNPEIDIYQQQSGYGQNQKPQYRNRIFYFEIPVNEGEFALGSGTTNGIANPTGAYLIYLDIASNSQDYERTTVNELIVEQEDVFNYYTGVLMVNATDKDDLRTQLTNATEETYSQAKVVQLNSTFNGTFTLSSDVVNNIDAEYGGMISGSVGNDPPSPERRNAKQSTVTTTKRVTFSDKNTTTNNVITSTAQKISVAVSEYGVEKSNVTNDAQVKPYGIRQTAEGEVYLAKQTGPDDYKIDVENGKGVAVTIENYLNGQKNESKMSVSALTDSERGSSPITAEQVALKTITWDDFPVEEDVNATNKLTYTYKTVGVGSGNAIKSDTEYIQVPVTFTDSDGTVNAGNYYYLTITAEDSNNVGQTIVVTFTSIFDAENFAPIYLNGSATALTLTNNTHLETITYTSPPDPTS